MKALLLVLLAVGVAFGFAGCGGEEQAQALDFGFGPATADDGMTESFAKSITIEVRPLEGVTAGDHTGGADESTLPENFAVQPGTPIEVTILNYTDVTHTFTAPELGVNRAIVPGGDPPSETRFTFSPEQPGVFQWFCTHCGAHMAGKVYAIIGYNPT